MESVTPEQPVATWALGRAQRLPASWNRSRSWGSRPATTRKRAQRLPASWNRSHGSKGSTCHGPNCAQRLPASWNRSPPRFSSLKEAAKVLNAFRHHGIGHYPIRGGTAVSQMCSTPSGIMESVTPRSESESGAVRSAQRLPASWNRSPVSPSTCTLMVSVLNAFRHHGIGHRRERVRDWHDRQCSTPSGIMESVTTIREVDCG